VTPLPVMQDGIVIGNRYDKYGSRHPWERWLMGGFERDLRDLLEQAQPVRSVLEVGCGEGHVTAKLAAWFPGARVLGTDFSSEIIAVARREHPGLEFRAHSVYDIAALAGEWDLVVACEVFEHLDDPARALRAVTTVARRAVLVTVPREPLWRLLNLARGRYWSALGNTDGHLQHWSRGALLRFLSGELDVIDCRSPLPWTQVLGRPRRVAAG
jgi:2-polyprenyl-3-methyl-5-hydroxy-6-metoxy-1,4-benzoquinol methylase